MVRRSGDDNDQSNMMRRREVCCDGDDDDFDHWILNIKYSITNKNEEELVWFLQNRVCDVHDTRV